MQAEADDTSHHTPGQRIGKKIVTGAGYQTWGRRVRTHRVYWLPSDVLSRGARSKSAHHGFPPSQIDAWCREILEHLGFSPPSGESWSGHSLRKGAASGAAAIDVALRKICFMGGWSILSRAVHDYIDPTCPASDACRRFFGWLRSS